MVKEEQKLEVQQTLTKSDKKKLDVQLTGTACLTTL